jgi:hypothetical protein
MTACVRIQDNVFGKPRGRKPYVYTATTANDALYIILDSIF